MPLHYWRVRFASEFGWTFAEFERLSVRQFQETLGVLEGMEKARSR